jgi:hypothetical protein
MNAEGELILAHLEQVDDERRQRAADPALSVRVDALKAYQQARFRRTYADLLGDARYGGAAQFFLEELYGPGDFSQRDAQFARIVPALVKLFPEEVVRTVGTLALLHALSERLDTQMARALASMHIDRLAYLRAWQATGDDDGRRAQIRLVVEVGASLDRLTRKPLLRQSLRLMRGPARAAGLGELQAFLERGFDTFGEMKGANGFLQTIAHREERLCDRLFGASVEDAAAVHPAPRAPEPTDGDPLEQLPPAEAAVVP